MGNDNISPEIYNFLNTIIDDLEDHTINYEGEGTKGDNFLGDILFINLKNNKTKEEIHLVIKQTFPNLGGNPMYQYVYKNEILFYQEIWKTLDEFQRAHKVGFDKIAKYLGADSTEGAEKIALDNLKYRGFALHDKSQPLSNRHVQMIMKSYGAFHAISFAYRELHPEEYAKLVEFSKNVSFKNMSLYYHLEFAELVKILENDIDDKIMKVLKNYVKESPKLFEDCLNYTGDTPVLVHGDCWSNNMMFKIDKQGIIEDMKFLDFQYMTSGTPVYDLAYSLYSGVSKEVLDNLDFYLKIYHSNFSNTLKKFGCDAEKSYPFEKLKEEWKKYCKFGYMMSLVIWRMKYVDKNNIPSIKDDTDNDAKVNANVNEEPTEDKKYGLPKVAADKIDVHKRRIIDILTHLYDNKYL